MTVFGMEFWNVRRSATLLKATLDEQSNARSEKEHSGNIKVVALIAVKFTLPCQKGCPRMALVMFQSERLAAA